MKTIGSKISELRKLKHMTQEELATQFNVSSQAVSKWENDLSIPDITLLIQMADFFEVSLDDLLRNQESNPTIKVVPEEIRKPIEKLMLKIIVNSKGNKVNINLPMKLVKTCMEIGMSLPTIKDNKVLQNVDLNHVLELVESGCIGTLMEIDTEQGEHVEIIVE